MRKKQIGKLILCSIIGLVLSTTKGSSTTISPNLRQSTKKVVIKHKFNWSVFIQAIIFVESNNNVNAKNGKCIGLMQISPILVRECNNILKKKESKKRFKLKDRKSSSKSKEMFILIQEEYNPKHDLRKAAKIWNAGNFSKKNPSRYIEKVMTKYRLLK